MQLLSPKTRKLLQKASQWYKGLKPRERWMLLGLALFLIFVGLQRSYQVYQTHKQELVDRMSAAQNTLLWIEESRVQLAQLHNQGAVQLSEQQLFDTLIKTSEELNIKIDLSPVEVDTRPYVQVTWKGSDPSFFMHYLSALSQRGANVKTLTLNRSNNQLFSAQARLEG